MLHRVSAQLVLYVIVARVHLPINKRIMFVKRGLQTLLMMHTTYYSHSNSIFSFVYTYLMISKRYVNGKTFRIEVKCEELTGICVIMSSVTKIYSGHDMPPKCTWIIVNDACRIRYAMQWIWFVCNICCDFFTRALLEYEQHILFKNKIKKTSFNWI